MRGRAILLEKIIFLWGYNCAAVRCAARAGVIYFCRNYVFRLKNIGFVSHVVPICAADAKEFSYFLNSSAQTPNLAKVHLSVGSGDLKNAQIICQSISSCQSSEIAIVLAIISLITHNRIQRWLRYHWIWGVTRIRHISEFLHSIHGNFFCRYQGGITPVGVIVNVNVITTM